MTKVLSGSTRQIFTRCDGFERHVIGRRDAGCVELIEHTHVAQNLRQLASQPLAIIVCEFEASERGDMRHNLRCDGSITHDEALSYASIKVASSSLLRPTQLGGQCRKPYVFRDILKE